MGRASAWGVTGSVLLAALGAAAPAGATVTVGVRTADLAFANGAVRQASGTRVVVTGDAAGQAVQVLGARPGVVTVSAPGAAAEIAAFAPVPPCTQVGPDVVDCPVPAAGPVVVVVQVLGGADTLVAAGSLQPFSLIADGGEGADRLFGGTGPDTIQGGPGDDVVDGGAGDDVLQGDPRGDLPVNPFAQGPGRDVVVGGPGADVLSGGARGDLFAGGEGRDRVTYDDGTPRPDGATVTLDGLCNDGARVDTEPVPATGGGGVIDGTSNTIGFAEQLPRPVTCSADGVERDNVAPDVEEVAGGPGPDRLTGDAAANTLVGGGGDDVLEGAGGPDALFGGPGSDLLLQRDLAADPSTSCDGEAFGAGTADRAVVDPADAVEPDCETVERGGAGVPGPVGGGAPPPPHVPEPPQVVEPGAPLPAALVPATAFTPAPRRAAVPSSRREGRGPGGGDGGRTAPEVAVTSPLASLDRAGRAELRVRCVYRARECVGTATVRLAAPAGRLRAGAVAGTARVRIPWGRSAPVRVRVAPALRAELRRTGRGVRTRVEVRARDGAAGPRAVFAVARRAVLLGAGVRGGVTTVPPRP